MCIRDRIEAPTGGRSATCVSCAHCPWMAMNGLVSVRDALEHPQDHEITVDPAVREPIWAFYLNHKPTPAPLEIAELMRYGRTPQQKSR